MESSGDDLKKIESERKRKLEQLEVESRERFVQADARKRRLEYADLFGVVVNLSALILIPEEEARSAGIAAHQLNERKLSLAIKDPDNAQARAWMERLGKLYTLAIQLVSERSLEWIFLSYKKIPKRRGEGAGSIAIDPVRLEKARASINHIKEAETALKELSAKNIGESLEVILAAALSIDASDVHIEPTEKAGRLKLRIDGLLQEIAELDRKVYEYLVNRIKLISSLHLNVKDVPQDGRFTIHTKEGDIEVRTSVLPGPNGENAVLRILNPKAISADLSALGLQPFQKTIVEEELSSPNGMILVTGPTGSGKTTTLYAFLQEKAKSPGLKIITLEDPIEYHLPSIEQTQVEPEKGFDFATGLKAVLRQDPDVILVGEMRDLETVQTALHASLTGHLVFSTLHTNDAPGVVPRIIDMGANVAIIAPAINVALAQRLVRKVCTKCVARETASEEELSKLSVLLAELPETIRHSLKLPKLDKSLQVARPKGCVACNESGYKGRVGIFEIFRIDDDMERLILSKPTEIEVRSLARKKGMVTMQEDGAIKVIFGITTLEELERVAGV